LTWYVRYGLTSRPTLRLKPTVPAKITHDAVLSVNRKKCALVTHQALGMVLMGMSMTASTSKLLIAAICEAIGDSVFLSIPLDNC
jgi:hypothetical protein